MRKRPFTPTPLDVPSRDEGWLDLDRIAVVEVTSEQNQYPAESAFGAEDMQGWRAADSGAQTIRLFFDKPQRLKRIALVFEETETERTQEFVLRWSPDSGRSFREIVRQQWNFSPPNQSAKWRNILLNFPISRCLNWSLCPTSIGDRFGPRSRACGCLDCGV